MAKQTHMPIHTHAHTYIYIYAHAQQCVTAVDRGGVLYWKK